MNFFTNLLLLIRAPARTNITGSRGSEIGNEWGIIFLYYPFKPGPKQRGTTSTKAVIGRIFADIAANVRNPRPKATSTPLVSP